MERASKRTSATNVDEYMELLPSNVRDTLEKLRKMIKSLVPTAEEVISYQVPSYKYHGMLVGFAGFKDHCSFFVMGPALMEAMKNDLNSYETSTGTIRFAANKPLPTALVKKIVMARVKENEERKLAKGKK